MAVSRIEKRFDTPILLNQEISITKPVPLTNAASSLPLFKT
jgi:hypothetical protein